MGVIAMPIPEHDFTGKIMIKRVSEPTKYKQKSHNQAFSDHAAVNMMLRNGEWRALVTDDDTTLGELKGYLQDVYDLEDDIKESLVLRYYLKDKKSGKKKPHYLDKDTMPVSSIRGCMDLMVRNEEGKVREVDVSCDSAFMERAMKEVGKSIRSSYHWVAIDHPIFLYLDNAGGHGTKEVVASYVKMLADDFNVVCIHQRPPATNMLDLGAWMVMQLVVEKQHFGRVKNPDVVWRTT